MKRFELIEHTADVGVRVYGKNLEELFINAALALFSLLIGNLKPGEKVKSISLEGQTLEDLVVGWLNELISLFFADKFLPFNFEVKIEAGNQPKKLEAKLVGIDFDPYSSKINMEIKAATYHNLKIEKNRKGYRVEIIFDV
jgi:SHS2 domain-containing protein